MHNGKIAVIGDKDSVLAFKAVGVDVYNSTPVDAQSILKKVAKDNYTIILITEEQAEAAHELIIQYKSGTYPIILPIPGSAGSNGLGIRGLKHNIEKAIGVDIVFDREDKK